MHGRGGGLDRDAGREEKKCKPSHQKKYTMPPPPGFIVGKFRGLFLGFILGKGSVIFLGGAFTCQGRVTPSLESRIHPTRRVRRGRPGSNAANEGGVWLGTNVLTKLAIAKGEGNLLWKANFAGGR